MAHWFLQVNRSPSVRTARRAIVALDRNRPALRLVALGALFLVSGSAALIYQIVWQRLLFTAFGVNIESVTLVVAVFMLGLGLGSLLGGRVSHRYPERLLHAFVACELVVGLFGIASGRLIAAVTQVVMRGPPWTIGVAAAGLLGVPTLFMGATLPMLVAYLHRRTRSVGRAVGVLYFVNTAGSAIACFATVDVMYARMGLHAILVVASSLNLVVAGLALALATGLRGDQQGATPLAEPVRPAQVGARPGSWALLFLAAATGYIALSQEILWTRAIAFATSDRADVFGHVLGFVLAGLALGSLTAAWWAGRGPDSFLRLVGGLLAISSAVYYASLPVVGRVLTWDTAWGLLACYALVATISFLNGAIFPALCHYAIRSSSAVGLGLSQIYFANIVGSTAGPVLTGFVLLDRLTLEQNALLLASIGAVLSVMVALAGAVRGAARAAWIGGVAAAAGVAFFTHGRTYDALLERLQFKTLYRSWVRFKYVAQNRSGILAVMPGPPDVLYGGGEYDGKFSIDPTTDANGIRRGYMIAGLHRDPRDMLEIGLGSGSWARVAADLPAVRALTIVEINPAYRTLIGHYPQIRGVIDDPKVTLAVDDGRRWLNRHPDARFDFILMNTTFFWRNMTSNLVSTDFLRLCKAHLKPGGVVYYNTTWSRDIPHTAATVFEHVVEYVNFVAVSDAPFDISPVERRANLLRFEDGGRPVFDVDRADLRALLDQMSQEELVDLGDELRRPARLAVITDDNMAAEFKASPVTHSLR